MLGIIRYTLALGLRPLLGDVLRLVSARQIGLVMLDPPCRLPHQFGVGEAEGVAEMDDGKALRRERFTAVVELEGLNL